MKRRCHGRVCTYTFNLYTPATDSLNIEENILLIDISEFEERLVEKLLTYHCS